MWLARTTAGLETVDESWLSDSLRVFDGRMTCCSMRHDGMGASPPVGGGRRVESGA
jgi:hypothetical protein